MVKGEVQNKIWDLINYCSKSTNCSTCNNADKNSWEEDTERGVCTIFKKLPFPIVAWGVCKLHTDLSICKK